jgi:very-short-patch-repair endonuclease
MMEMTPIERWLWADIRQCNAIFYPQFPVAGVFVDFANPKALVAIECDGAAYHLDKEKDAARDARLGALGWTVYRITGADCAKEYDEETHTPSPGFQFVREIAERHRLSRHHRSRPFTGLGLGRFAHA